ncbi:Protein kinase-like domain [Pseudocohnilembus persalinus]|uniref:non-specific serine/threonine protein kinase n=1 Tax=Pseudocohnilembus persalinus TaxID=266149 RepID=A0A0V0QNK6_PSEPJ|nr:Protein kinase-like domain [Pseudocohnilembus persalinus]|eukprot:KRX03812.1 Protein kinase-like domain [Pseudocohnilembus persalinus]
MANQFKNLKGKQIKLKDGSTLSFQDKLGEGAFSNIFNTNDENWLIKMLSKSNQKAYQTFKTEVNFFKKLSGFEPHLIKLKDSQIVNFKELGDQAILVIEKCHRGNLFDVLGYIPGMNLLEFQIIKIIKDATLALKKVHSLGFVHRDVKLENILLTKDGNYKLCDFGSVSQNTIIQVNDYNREEVKEDIEANTTPQYRAPEQIDFYSNFEIGIKVDIFALGVVAFILCFQKPPFESSLATINTQFFVPSSHQFSGKILKLIQLMLMREPEQRFSAQQILDYIEQNYPEDINEKGKINPELFKNGNQSHIQPSFLNKCKKYITRWTKQSEGWIVSALEENDSGPKQKYVRFLVLKAWQKRQKVAKHYQILGQQLQIHCENPIICLKMELLLHNYFKKAPPEAINKINKKPYEILMSLKVKWEQILATLNTSGSLKNQSFGSNNSTNFQGQFRTQYNIKLIINYAQILLEKLKIANKFVEIMQGNFSLSPFFEKRKNNEVKQVVTPISIKIIENLLKYFRHLVEFHDTVIEQYAIWNIQCAIMIQLIDEEYCLISLLVHLLHAFKQKSNYKNVKLEVEKNDYMVKILEFEESFSYCFKQANTYFLKCSNLKDSQKNSLNKIIPKLNQECLEFLIGIPTFQNTNDDFQIFKYLGEDKSIYQIRIPQSYGKAAQNFNIDEITRLQEKSYIEYKYNQGKVQKLEEKADYFKTGQQSIYNQNNSINQSQSQKNKHQKFEYNERKSAKNLESHGFTQNKGANFSKQQKNQKNNKQKEGHLLGSEEDLSPLQNLYQKTSSENVSENNDFQPELNNNNFDINSGNNLNSQQLYSMKKKQQEYNDLFNQEFSQKQLQQQQQQQKKENNQKINNIIENQINTNNINDLNNFTNFAQFQFKQEENQSSKKRERESAEAFQNFDNGQNNNQINNLNNQQEFNFENFWGPNQNNNNSNQYKNNQQNNDNQNQNLVQQQQLIEQQMNEDKNDIFWQFSHQSINRDYMQNQQDDFAHQKNQISEQFQNQNQNQYQNVNDQYGFKINFNPNQNQQQIKSEFDQFDKIVQNNSKSEIVQGNHENKFQNLNNQNIQHQRPVSQHIGPSNFNNQNAQFDIQKHISDSQGQHQNQNQNHQLNFQLKENKVNNNNQGIQNLFQDLIKSENQKNRFKNLNEQQFNQNSSVNFNKNKINNNLNSPFSQNEQNINNINQNFNDYGVGQTQFKNNIYNNQGNNINNMNQFDQNINLPNYSPNENGRYSQNQNQNQNFNNRNSDNGFSNYKQNQQNQNQTQTNCKPGENLSGLLDQINFQNLGQQQQNYNNSNEQNQQQKQTQQNQNQIQNSPFQKKFDQKENFGNFSQDQQAPQQMQQLNQQQQYLNNNQLENQLQKSQKQVQNQSPNMRKQQQKEKEEEQKIGEENSDLSKQMKKVNTKNKQTNPNNRVNQQVNIKTLLEEHNEDINDWLIDIKEVKFQQQIGSGNSSEVYKGKCRGINVAVKKMRIKNMKASHFKEFQREIGTLVKLKPQPNLVSLIGISQKLDEFYIITEYCSGGTLFDLLHRKTQIKLSWTQRLKMCKDIAYGIFYLHQCKPPIIHRDLKSLNLLLDTPVRNENDKINIKIADFGLARTNDTDLMTGVLGTFHWMAPEIFDSKPYSIKADVYSFGICIWEIMCRETPYKKQPNPPAIMKFVTIDKGRPDLTKIPRDAPQQLIDLMHRCWHQEQEKRPMFSEILKILNQIDL